MKNLEFEVLHVGINQSSREEALKSAELLKNLFGFDKTETPISYFSSSHIEIMKHNGAGTYGHIAVGTNDIEAARKYLEQRGVEFDEDSAAYTEDGKLRLIYLKKKIAGFAFHLLQK